MRYLVVETKDQLTRYFLAVAFQTLSICLLGQTFSHVYDFHNRGLNDRSFGLIDTEDGFRILTFGFGPIDYEQRLGSLNLNPSGIVVSEHEFYYEDMDLFPGSTSGFALMADESLVIAGGRDSLYGPLETRVTIFNMAPTGEIVEAVDLQNEALHIGSSIVPLADGYMAIGNAFITSDEVLGIFLMKLDQYFQEQWVQYYQEEPQWLTASHVESCSDGSWIITGAIEYIDKSDECSTSAADWDMFILKTDEQGNELWRQTIGSCEFEGYPGMLTLNDGGIILVNRWGEDEPIFGDTFLEKAAIRKIGCDGNLIWENVYGEPALEFALFGVAETESGDLISVGIEWILGENGPHYHGIIMSVSSEGDLLWKRDYQYDDMADCGLNAVIIDDQNGIVTSGWSNNSSQNGSQDAWVMRLDEFGCLEPDCHLSTDEFMSEDLGLFPNPAINEISIEGVEGQNRLLEMYSLAGVLVHSSVIANSASNRVSIVDLPSGCYLIRLRTSVKTYSEYLIKM